MAARRTLQLKTQQRRELEEYRDHDPRPYLRERCGALLKIAGGASAHAVARQGLPQPSDPDTLYGVVTALCSGGVSGLVATNTGATVGGVFEAREGVKAQLLETLHAGPGAAARQEVMVGSSGPAWGAKANPFEFQDALYSLYVSAATAAML